MIGIDRGDRMIGIMPGSHTLAFPEEGFGLYDESLDDGQD